MAVLSSFECSILVDGKALKEYDDDEPDPSSGQRAVSKYVPATAGAHFSVECKVRPKFCFGSVDLLAFNVSLDGVFQTCVSMEKSDYSRRNGFRIEQDGVPHKVDEGHTVQKFRFAKITTRESDTRDQGRDPKIQLCQLAKVTVEVWRQRYVVDDPGESSESDDPHDEQSPASSNYREPGICHGLGDEAIPSKILKGSAVDLQARLDEAQPGRDYEYVNSEDIGRKPMASFTFKYRSLEALKQLHIIPRTPSPVPLEARPRGSLTYEEFQELLSRREAESEVSRVRIKKERAEQNLHTLRPVKRFRDDLGVVEDNEVEAIASRPAKQRRPDSEIEVVDLSD